jgi:hypothetical protein
MPHVKATITELYFLKLPKCQQFQWHPSNQVDFNSLLELSINSLMAYVY